jgi:hypothetical protein
MRAEIWSRNRFYLIPRSIIVFIGARTLHTFIPYVFKISFIVSIYACVFKVLSFLQVFRIKLSVHFFVNDNLNALGRGLDSTG